MPFKSHPRSNQRGSQILEFALVAAFFVPLLLGSFVTGMNLMRSVQANQVCRDLADIYIHGGDFSSYAMQQLAQRLATGMNLQIGTSFAGNSASNTGNSGYGIVTITQFMYVGSTTSPSCVSVGASNCVNHDSFVFTQRIRFGNGAISTDPGSFAGAVSGSATITNSGVVQNPATDSAARISTTPQANLSSLWQVNSGGRSPLVDGQVVYMAEVYFQTPDLAMGNFSSNGVYSRYFF